MITRPAAGDDTSGDLLSSCEILSTGSRFNEATSVFKIHIVLSIRCYARRVLSMQSVIILCRHYQITFMNSAMIGERK